MMTRRNLRALAILLGQHNAHPDLVLDIMNLCAQANPRFKPERFHSCVDSARAAFLREEDARYEETISREAASYEYYETPSVPELGMHKGRGVRLKLGTGVKEIPMAKVERGDLYGWDKVEADDPPDPTAYRKLSDDVFIVPRTPKARGSR